MPADEQCFSWEEKFLSLKPSLGTKPSRQEIFCGDPFGVEFSAIRRYYPDSMNTVFLLNVDTVDHPNELRLVMSANAGISTPITVCQRLQNDTWQYGWPDVSPGIIARPNSQFGNDQLREFLSNRQATCLSNEVRRLLVLHQIFFGSTDFTRHIEKALIHLPLNKKRKAYGVFSALSAYLDLSDL